MSTYRRFENTNRVGDARYVVREFSPAAGGWLDVTSWPSLSQAERQVNELTKSGVRLAIVKRREVGLREAEAEDARRAMPNGASFEVVEVES